ncbi:hypothetical protein CR513_09445, partial [Mucuna pruriens]
FAIVKSLKGCQGLDVVFLKTNQYKNLVISEVDTLSLRENPTIAQMKAYKKKKKNSSSFNKIVQSNGTKSTKMISNKDILCHNQILSALCDSICKSFYHTKLLLSYEKNFVKIWV